MKALAIALVFAPLLAAFQAVEPEEEDTRSPATRFAAEAAAVAGGAMYCEMDPRDIETYLNHAHARLAALASDDVDLVVSRIEFSNRLSRAKTSEPRNGCEGYGDYFSSQLTRISG